MQAIKTRYIGQTDTRPSRYVATAEAGRLIVPTDHALNAERNHMRAALAFVKKMGWNEAKGYQGIIGGQFGSDMYWVLCESFATRSDFDCPLCGQHITDGKPCGCGARS